MRYIEVGDVAVGAIVVLVGIVVVRERKKDAGPIVQLG